MSKVLVFGHQNPDTDAIASSMSFAYFMKEANSVDTQAVALGELNEETKFALSSFGVAAPKIIDTVKKEGCDTVILTDHNEFQQSAKDIEDVTIMGVVDHHRIANFQTADPLFFRAEPVGSASSIVYRMFKERGLEVPKELAGMMLSGLISDTLLLKSPTTHVTDHNVAKELAEIAGVDLETYGLEMLKAGTNLSKHTAIELIDLDAKTFPLAGNDVRVAQVNTVDIPETLTRLDELKEAMRESSKENGYSDFVLVVTDIVNSNSQLIHVGENASKIEEAFHTTLTDDNAFLEGVVSRKKQVVPQLTQSFEK